MPHFLRPEASAGAVRCKVHGEYCNTLHAWTSETIPVHATAAPVCILRTFIPRPRLICIKMRIEIDIYVPPLTPLTSVRAPPAYVTGMGDPIPNSFTSSSSMPSCMPSTSTPCTKNSSQLSASWAREACDGCEKQHLIELCEQAQKASKEVLCPSINGSRDF